MWRKPCSAILSHCEFKVFDLQAQSDPCFKWESQHVNLTESLNLLMSINETMSAIMILLCIPFFTSFQRSNRVFKELTALCDHS